MKCVDVGCKLLPLGSAQSHCTACHSTFSNPTTFDSHRLQGKCVAPSVLCLVECEGVWGSAAYVEQVARMKVARSAK